MAKTDLEIFIEEETVRMKSTGVPVKASLPERLLTRNASVKRIHPNPEDEFTFPDIGPNMNIISSYTTQFVNNLKRSLPLMDEPLYVQKIRPSGYMLLNGHHRWIAAMRLGIKKVPVSVVNAVFDSDIKSMLEHATHEKRASLDLDEVIFASPGENNVEKHRGLIGYGIQKKRLRLGIPALLNNLKVRGYDIWVYSSKFYSVDDLKRYFGHYKVSIDGVITGMKKQTSKSGGKRKKVEEMISDRYKTTLHIDREMLLITHGKSNDFNEIEINCEPQAWAGAVIDAIDRADK